ncbi:hypothetical protein QYF36_009825 [Acer negundo]|nr:hypothetical protein QYF36_009825 [Acer negundo]
MEEVGCEREVGGSSEATPLDQVVSNLAKVDQSWSVGISRAVKAINTQRGPEKSDLAPGRGDSKSDREGSSVGDKHASQTNGRGK